MKQKTYHDVKGWQSGCLSYEKCPLCYGCRAYNPAHLTCEKCARNMKLNVCDVKKHQPHLLAKMMKRETIVIGEDKS